MMIPISKFMHPMLTDRVKGLICSLYLIVSFSNALAADRVKSVKCSQERGFFEEPFQLRLRTSTQGAQIRYTTNGSTPTENNGQIYKAPLSIHQTTVLRARAFKEGMKASKIKTRTFLFPRTSLINRLMESLRQVSLITGAEIAWTTEWIHVLFMIPITWEKSFRA